MRWRMAHGARARAGRLGDCASAVVAAYDHPLATGLLLLTSYDWPRTFGRPTRRLLPAACCSPFAARRFLLSWWSLACLPAACPARERRASQDHNAAWAARCRAKSGDYATESREFRRHEHEQFMNQVAPLPRWNLEARKTAGRNSRPGAEARRISAQVTCMSCRPLRNRAIAPGRLRAPSRRRRVRSGGGLQERPSVRSERRL